jgi:hypothetical protein
MVTYYVPLGQLAITVFSSAYMCYDSLNNLPEHRHAMRVGDCHVNSVIPCPRPNCTTAATSNHAMDMNTEHMLGPSSPGGGVLQTKPSPTHAGGGRATLTTPPRTTDRAEQA